MLIYTQRTIIETESGAMVFHDPFSPLTIKVLPWDQGLKTVIIKQGFKEIRSADDELAEFDVANFADEKFRDFLNRIPEQLRKEFQSYKFAQLTMLRLTATFEAALELRRKNKNLLWLLACEVARQNWDDNKVEALLNHTQGEIIKQLFPSCPIGGNILKNLKGDNFIRIDFEAFDIIRKSPRIVKSLNHGSELSIYLLRSMKRFPQLSQSKLLLEGFFWLNIEKQHLKMQQRILSGWLDTWNDCIKIARKVGIENPTSVLEELPTENDFQRIHDRWSKKLEKTEVQKMPSFPDPPVPGNSHIRAITSPLALKQEGNELQHCVFIRADDVYSGSRYIYKVLEPQRGTLSLNTVTSNYFIEEFSLKNNNSPAKETRDHAERWLQEWKKGQGIVSDE